MAKKLLSYNPQTSLSEGLKKVVNWYKKTEKQDC
jgi:nucleoside-diphosphate-sugar epimerase